MSIHKYLYTAFFKPYLRRKLRKDLHLKIHGFKILVKKGVFHPKYFFSTEFLYQFITKLELKGHSFLEIGSGSGVLSLLAYRKGASVTCLDIDVRAIETTAHNFDSNFANHNAKILQSDLFERLPKKDYDFIIINPPYFFGEVYTGDQYAWYCGANGEYFEKLFSSIHGYMDINSSVFMVLAENCDLERIRTIAKKYGISLVLKEEKKIKWEKNFIFKLISHAHRNGSE